jgi:hypothetical protein
VGIVSDVTSLGKAAVYCWKGGLVGGGNCKAKVIAY